jgi:hypothetical protein
MSRKVPEIDQLLIIFHAASDMTREKAISVAKDLCLHCCRLQQEIAGQSAIDSDMRLVITSLAQSCKDVLSAIEQADLGGEVLWINRGSAVHETASERLQSVIYDSEKCLK